VQSSTAGPHGAVICRTYYDRQTDGRGNVAMSPQGTLRLPVVSDSQGRCSKSCVRPAQLQSVASITRSYLSHGVRHLPKPIGARHFFAV